METELDRDSQWPSDVLLALGEVDRRLQALGEHPISPWWWDEIRAFYESSAWKFIGRVGRRGGKSDTWSKVAIAEIVSGRFPIPLGDTGVVSIVSTDREEAAKRVKTIAAYCAALQIEHHATAAAIAFPGRPYAVEVKTASVRGVSGFTSILCIGDEVDKWRDTDTGANPAEAVLSSWTPTLATMLPLGARMALLSSPWLYSGPHSREFDRGVTSSQRAAYAPTWVAHPAMTEILCRQLEPDETRFLREYAAIPQADAASGIGKDQVERATRAAIDRDASVQYVAAFSLCRSDPMWRLLVVGRRRDTDGSVRTAVFHVREWPGLTEPRPVLRELGTELRRFGLSSAYVPGDTAGELLRIASRLDVGLTPWPVTEEMHDSLRVRFADDGVELPRHAGIAASILDVRRDGTRLVASGYAVLLALAADRSSGGPADQDRPPSRAVIEARAAIPTPEEEERLDREAAEADTGGDWLTVLRDASGYE